MFFLFFILFQAISNSLAESSLNTDQSVGNKLIETLKKQNADKDPLIQEFNAEYLEKKYVTNPKLDSTSSDQIKRNQELEKLEEKSAQDVTRNTMELYKCRNLKELKAISNCKQNYIKALSKK